MNHIFKFVFTLLVLNILFLTPCFNQGNQAVITVKDDSGNPVAGAKITVGEGSEPVITNEKGEFQLNIQTGGSVLIEAAGHDSQLIPVTTVLTSKSISLVKSVFQMGDKDKAAVPFGVFGKRQIPAAVTVLDPKEILKSDQQKSVDEILNGNVPGLFGSSILRGNAGSPLIIVDGIPRSASDFNIQQIEQISILKDLSSTMLYGSLSTNGVILITTKRGEPLRKNIQIFAERGLNKPVSYPEYLAASDYMELYNEALLNDGLPVKYTTDDILKTRSGTDPVRYPDEDYYNSTYLNDSYSFFNLVGEASGGNEIARYYLNLGWNHLNSLLKLGEGNNENFNRLNMRGNVDYKITNNIDLKFDGMVVFNISRTPRYTGNNFWELSTTLHPDYYPLLIPTDLIKDEDLLRAAKLVDGKYLLGGTSEFQSNIYGELTKNGYSNYNNRLFHLNTGLKFDLNFLTEGLTANTNISLDMFNMFKADLENSYAVYQLFYNADTISSISLYGLDVRQENQTVSNVDFYRRNVIYGTLDYKRTFSNDHTVTANLLAYRDVYNIQQELQPTKHLHFGLRGNYTYRNKYVAEFTGTIAGSGKLFESNRYAFSPGIGIGWILTEETFLKDNPIIDYLKLRTNYAIVNTDENIGYYYYEDWFGLSSTYYYGQGTYNNTSRYLYNGNPELEWEKVMNTNIGFESMLLKSRLGFEFSYFYSKAYDLISQKPNSLPAYFTGNMYQNFGSNRVQGFEAGLNYKMNIAGIEVRIGSIFSYAVPKALKVDEINYKEEYLKRQGQATDAIFGWVALGLFKDQADIDNNAIQTFGTVKPGDIKYKDLNNDGIIDDLDQMLIGNSRARFEYGLNVSLKYKKFELFTLGTGQTGQNLIFNNPYYWVYGDRKYSEVVWDRWTPLAASTATYPRLSSSSNPNNFRNSTFWLEDNNWFKLHTLQLTYTLPKLKFAGLDEVLVYLRGSNLVTISKIKDKIDLNIGSAPQIRAFSLGLTTTF